MGELRTNPVTGSTVVVAPRRGLRPRDEAAREPSLDERGFDRDPGCPFCPGNEEELPRILWQAPAADPPGWSMRAVPNRYSAFHAEARAGSDAAPARGRQEVVIESPGHGRDLSRMEPAELSRVLAGYALRFRALADSGEVERVFLFRNHGSEAGASLSHPHAQVVGTGFVPPPLRRLEAHVQAASRSSGGCVLCRLPEVEPAWAHRLVHETKGFWSFVPWAAETPHEIWIVPRRHVATFAFEGDDEREELAWILGALLRLLRRGLRDPAYNLILYAAARSGAEGQLPHWWLQLRPRTGHPAGFELGGGIPINPSSPERDAARVRELLSEDGSSANGGGTPGPFGGP